MKNWAQEMELDGYMNELEISKFLKIIEKAGIPSIEEYANGKYRDEVAGEYWDRYGDIIRASRDEATE